jgi:lariat debranching enzyme
VAPILTIFIGGNHEASNYLQELAYGGWVAPNIYYLGYAGVIRVNGIRIGGISGIFRDYHFEKGHFEFPPYDQGSVRSAYAIRSIEVFRLSQLTGSMDVMLSHDWPEQIWEYGNKEQLLRFKPYFREDMESGKMGSGPCWDLLTTLKPRHWYAAHMHCRFDANVQHDNNESTKFVALDKCLPNRKFLDFLNIGEEEEEGQTSEWKEPIIQYDLEWLTVLYLTNNLLNVNKNYTKLPLQPGPDDPQDNLQRSLQRKKNWTPFSKNSTAI